MTRAFNVADDERENRARFEALLSTADDGIIMIDADGVVEIYNPACERLLGYRADEVIGRNVTMLMPSPYREAHDGYLEHYRRTGERHVIGIGREVVACRKDGSILPVFLSVGEGRINGRIVYVGILHDITERLGVKMRLQELQAELLHISRLSAMGQMTSALAHELNQPLAAIMNYAKAAQRTLETPDAQEPPQLRQAAELIEKAAAQAGRAGQIIRRLRDFIEIRHTARAREDLNRVVDDAIALGLIGTADLNVTLRVDLAKGIPPVFIDRIQIQQVLLNLIRNAIEAMQSVARRELSITTALEQPGFVLVSVSDTGPGLDKEIASRLFLPFMTTKETGMGIGLSICRSIIDAHGGHIWASANEEGGVAFLFRLPLEDVLNTGHDG